MLIAPPHGASIDPSLNVGLRISAMFIAIVGSFALGRWLQSLVCRIPARVRVADDGKSPVAGKARERAGFVRWLGYFAFACVMLAGIAAALAILGYNNIPHTRPFDPTTALAAFETFVAPRIIFTLLLAAGTLAACRLLQGTTVLALDRARIDPSLQVLAGRSVYIAVLIIGGLIILGIWGISPVVPAALLAVVTVGLGLALQDVLRNLFAGVYLLIERPFVIGDEITVNTFTGRDADIELRVTTLRTSDGQEVLVPNAILFTSAVVNATPTERKVAAQEGRRRLLLAGSMPIVVAEDPRRRTVLNVTLPGASVGDFAQIEQRLAAAIAKVKNIRRAPAPEIALNHVGQGKVDLSVAFWVPARDPRLAQDAIAGAISQIYATAEDAEVSVGEAANVT
jgi:small-conductance mechanosensitive channel